MIEKNGVVFLEYEDAEDMVNGYYHLYHFNHYDNINIPDYFEYDGIVEFCKYDYIYEFSVIGWEVNMLWEKNVINSNRGIQNSYLVGPILEPINIKDLNKLI